jgi:hypothetical protein
VDGRWRSGWPGGRVAIIGRAEAIVLIRLPWSFRYFCSKLSKMKQSPLPWLWS